MRISLSQTNSEASVDEPEPSPQVLITQLNIEEPVNIIEKMGRI